MKVDLLRQNMELLVHLDLQVVTTSLNLGIGLLDLFHLLLLKLVPLVPGTLFSEIFDSLRLFDLKHLELLSVVHGFLSSLIDCDELLVLLHFFQLETRLDLEQLSRLA